MDSRQRIVGANPKRYLTPESSEVVALREIEEVRDQWIEFLKSNSTTESWLWQVCLRGMLCFKTIIDILISLNKQSIGDQNLDHRVKCPRSFCRHLVLNFRNKKS